jgi:hypothetical protein
VHRVRAQDGEVDVLEVQRPLLVEPGEREQVLDEQAHPRGLVLDAAQQPRDVAGVGDRALPVQLGEAADRGQGGAQLVARVRDEAAQALVGGVACGEGVLHARHHPVEGAGEPAQLGGGVSLGHPAVELSGGDGGGRLLHLDRGPARLGPHRGQPSR